MNNFTQIEIPITAPPRSLCWHRDMLVDWASGCRRFTLESKELPSLYAPPFVRFDASTSSPSGAFAVCYERFGTKGLLFNGVNHLREINRSCYCADAYEYPVSLLQLSDGRELLAHCPEDYNRIEIDDALTGERLTTCPQRKPCDFFHSRLAVSPTAKRILSAGWHWHPLDSVYCWDIAQALQEPTYLDECKGSRTYFENEIFPRDAVFLDDDRIALSLAPEPGFSEIQGLQTSLDVINVATNETESSAPLTESLGAMLPVNPTHVVAFHDTPRLIDLRDGSTQHRWTNLDCGRRTGSITGHLGPQPHIALDTNRKRFAVAQTDRITVVSLASD